MSYKSILNGCVPLDLKQRKELSELDLKTEKQIELSSILFSAFDVGFWTKADKDRFRQAMLCPRMTQSGHGSF